MATDVRLDEGDGTFLILASRVVKAEASDFMLDSSDRRTSQGYRRALVHDKTDGLTINYLGDYPGGVAINGSNINLNGPAGARVTIDQAGTLGATANADQVTLHGAVINLDTLSADALSAGDVRLTFQHPDELDQNGNPRIAGFPETVFLGALLTQLRNEIEFLKARVDQLEAN